MIVESLKEGFKEGDREGRVCLISALLLSASIYLSGMNAITSSVAITISAIYTKGRSVKLFKGFAPLIVLLLLTGAFAGLKTAIETTLAFLGILSAGSIVLATKRSELAGALIYFKVPEKFVSYITIALSLLPIVFNDFENVMFLHREGRISKYYNILKSLVSTVVLRSLSHAETLFCKNFKERVYYEVRKPEKSDVIFLSAVLLLFSSTALLHLFRLTT